MSIIKIGVIGLGNMGSAHIESINKLENVKLVAVCDVQKKLTDKISEQYKVNSYADGFEMINSGEVNAILIATPHYDHTPLTIAAFEKGLHVLTEKPVAVHTADAQKMNDAYSKHSHLKYAAMFQQRTFNANKKIKKLIDTGELGKIKRVNWIITTWFRSQSYYDSGGWRATWEGEGGGVLLNQCPHQLDLFQWFFGMPVKVRAFCAIGKYHNIEVEDEVTAYCEFENGATGVFITSTGEAPGTNRLEITGDKGRLVFENGKISFKRAEETISTFLYETETSFSTPDMWDIEIPFAKDTASAHQLIIENFIDAILNNSPLIAPAIEGINSVSLGNSMLLSSLQETTIDMPIDALAFEQTLQELIENSNFKKEVKETSKGNDEFSNSF